MLKTFVKVFIPQKSVLADNYGLYWTARGDGQVKSALLEGQQFTRVVSCTLREHKYSRLQENQSKTAEKAHYKCWKVLRDFNKTSQTALKNSRSFITVFRRFYKSKYSRIIEKF